MWGADVHLGRCVIGVSPALMPDARRPEFGEVIAELAIGDSQPLCELLLEWVNSCVLPFIPAQPVKTSSRAAGEFMRRDRSLHAGLIAALCVLTVLVALLPLGVLGAHRPTRVASKR